GRRDRRRRRGAGRRVHRRRGLEAGRRLHRRLHRAARQADGPRRGDHLRLLWHRRGEERGARGEGRAGRRKPDRDGGDRRRGPAVAVGGLGRGIATVELMAGGTISFARGAPSADILPHEQVREAAARALAEDWETALSYGVGIGHPGLCQWIAERHAGLDPAQVMVTNGSLEAGAMLFWNLLGPGDRVAVEQPTYDRTLLLLR